MLMRTFEKEGKVGWSNNLERWRVRVIRKWVDGPLKECIE